MFHRNNVTICSTYHVHSKKERMVIRPCMIWSSQNRLSCDENLDLFSFLGHYSIFLYGVSMCLANDEKVKGLYRTLSARFIRKLSTSASSNS